MVSVSGVGDSWFGEIWESEEKSLQGRRTEVNGYILQPMINLIFASVEGGVLFKAALIHDELAPQN